MKPEVGQYSYVLRGRGFRIYRCVKATESGYTALPVPGERTYSRREDARRRVYELNGWRIKE